MRLLAGLAVAAALALPAVPRAAPPPPEARAEKERGDARRAAGDEAGAVEAYRAALQLHPPFAEVHEALGQLHYARKRYAEALTAFESAVAIDGEYALAWYNLAFAARKAGQLRRAEEGYRRYLKLRPDDLDARYGLAETLAAAESREAAVAAYDAYLAPAAKVPGEARRVERARDALRRLAAERAAPPAGGVAARGPAGVAVGAAAPAAAVAGAAAGVPGGIMPPDPNAAPTQDAGPVTAAKGAGAAGAGAPPMASSAGSESRRKVAAGDRLAAEGNVRRALYEYQDATHVAPLELEPRLKLGAAYLELQHPAEAIAQYELALLIDPASSEARDGLSRARRQAEATADGAHRSSRPAPGAAGDAPAAATAAAADAAALSISPASGPAAAAASLAGTAAVGGPPATAAVATVAAPPGPSAEPEALRVAAAVARRYEDAIALMGRKKYARAAGELDAVLRERSDLAPAWAARGAARFGQGRFADAASDYRKALELDPGLSIAVYGLAECYRQVKDPAAIEYYERYAASGARDVREDLRAAAKRQAQELRNH